MSKALTDVDTVERVAKAIYRATALHYGAGILPWDEMRGIVKRGYFEQARAAIAALPPAVPDTTPDPVSEVKVPAIPKPNYVQTKPNQWVWNVCEGYEVIITKALGGDQDWSFRVNNSGRCFLASKEVAMEKAMDALGGRVAADTRQLNSLSKRLRALTKDGEAG